MIEDPAVQCGRSYLAGVVDLSKPTAPEPSKRFFEPLAVFKTASLNHSDIPPTKNIANR